MSDYNFKYRPQKIGELNLTLVRDDLTSVFKSGKIPHAFLFTGPRGIGKTSAARIVAKTVNCVGKKQGEIEPCGECDQCNSITTGNNLDVLEIDAASNRGIDDIRELRERVRLAPVKASYKVYIIDEVHMLTTEAFNALLKTLEEPPKHVIFILCTTEVEKLPETIISRCLRLNFKKAKIDEVIEKLEKVSKWEKLKVTPEALKLLARGSSGSFRDALKILEHASFAQEEVTEEKIKEILGQTVGSQPQKLLDSLVKKETKEALAEINRAVNLGCNLRIYTEELLELLRATLLQKLGVATEEEPGIGNWEPASPAGRLGIGETKRLIEIFSKAFLELKGAVIPQLPLELAVVEWCEGDGSTEERKPYSAEAPRGKQEEGEKKAEDKTNEEMEDGRNKIESGKDIKNGENENITLKNCNLSIDDIHSSWSKVLSAVKPKNFSIEACLRSARPLGFDGKILTIEVFYRFHKDKLESDKCLKLVEETAASVYGLPLIIHYTLGEKLDKPVQVSENTVSAFGKGGETAEAEEDIFSVAEKIFSEEENKN
ncbi:MAG: DNA polymerase III subunit gamma/tau [bacterium]|nr:DNA polymerase III subunit gamma/tau [bacterium]